MEIYNQESKSSLGNKGELYVIDKLKTQGFELYKKNIRRIGSEIDVVMYRFDTKKYVLDIRIIEVKTRRTYEVDLASFNISKKWSLIRRYIYSIKAEIDAKFEVLKYSEVHFDLALVRYSIGSGSDLKFNMYSYIKDVNLLL